MISFANNKTWSVFLFGNNSLHMRWLGSATSELAHKWQRSPTPEMAQVLICEGPWTMERAFLLREIHAQMHAPRMIVFSGPVSLPEQTILEALMDHVDVFLPEGIEQFWRGDTQDLMIKFLESSPEYALDGLL